MMKVMCGADKTAWIVAKARELGFDLCGVAPAEDWEELRRLPEWLARGYAGEMRYMRDPRRESAARVLEGASSVIVTALNYNTPFPYSTEAVATEDEGVPRGWISRYAWGDDYHRVMGEKLEKLVSAMRAEFTEPFMTRAYVDTGPILERVVAKHAGLGWLAKNTLLINENLGSWLFLGVILTTLELVPSLAAGEAPPADLCGNCRLCIDACPTGAIVEPYVLDARQCISYLTIELRGAIPENLRPAMDRAVFGCDVCQDVCPWNSPRRAPTTAVAAFLPSAMRKQEGTRNSKIEAQASAGGGIGEFQVSSDESRDSLFEPAVEWLAGLSEHEFDEIFRGSAIRRAKWRGLIRNACVAVGNARVAAGSPAYARAVALLESLSAQEDSVISEHARWALARLHAI